MKIVILFLCVLFSLTICGMDFITQTSVEPSISAEKKDTLYQTKRDKLLCSYKCLYQNELLARHSVRERDEMAVVLHNDLEKRIAHLKKQLIEELWTQGAGLASAAANGTAFYYSDDIMPFAGFLVSLMLSAVYLESTLLETRCSLGFNGIYLKKFKKVKMLKELEMVISDNYEEK